MANTEIIVDPTGGGGGGGGDFTSVKKLEAPESYAGNVGTTRETTCKVSLEANKIYRVQVDVDGGVTRVGSATLTGRVFLSYSGTSSESQQGNNSGTIISYSGLYTIDTGTTGKTVSMIGHATSVGTTKYLAVIYAGIHTDTAGDLALRIYASGVGNNASDEIFINGATMYVQEV